MGDQQVDPAVESRHLSAIARFERVRRLRRRLGAALAGLALFGGGGGLAYAGELPGPAQEVAHDMLGAVGLEVPPGHDRVVDAEACPGGTIDPDTGEAYRTHGQYVRDHNDDEGAGQTDCAKPRKAVEKPNGQGDDDPAVEGQGKAHGKDHGKGKPESLGEPGTQGQGQGEGSPPESTPAGPPAEVPPQAPGTDDAPPADPGQGQGGPPASVPAGPPAEIPGGGPP